MDIELMLPLVDIQEQIILGVASGEVSREQLVEWLREHTRELNRELWNNAK